jgi:hypothetical protein
MTELKEEWKKEKEEEKKAGSDEIKQYMEKTFGKGKAEILKSRLDLEGKLNHLVFIPKYEWFQDSTYEWYDVFAHQNGYKHEKLEQPY